MAVTLAASLIGSGLGVVVGEPGTALATSSSAPNCSVAEAVDEAAAAALAAECGVSVEALSERTEFEQVVVDPSGTQTVTVAAVPQRVRRGDGSWAAIDPTLSVAGGVVVPAATLADVRFSAGGSGPLATWWEGGSSFTVSWPLGALPAPRLIGATAVYEGVLPGVNLHVTALREGFSHAVEIVTPAAAANPAVRQIRYALGGDLQVESDAGGGLRLVDPVGETVAVTHAASMWDSSVDPAIAGEVISARGGGQTEVEPATGAEPSVTSRRVGVAVEVDDGDLTVFADEAMLADPEVAWPVFVDPPFNGLRSKWAYANNANKNWDVGNRAWVGRNSYDGVLYRSFFDFNVSTLRGTQILSAKVTMKLDHSWSCDPTWVHLYRTNTDGITVSSGGRMAWSTRPLPSSHWLDSWEGNANEAGGCGSIQPDADAVFEGSTLKNDVQARATANATTYTVGLCACNSAGELEATQSRWKKFFTNQTYLVATYDKKPNAPVAQAFLTTTDCYKACTSPAVVRTTTPTLRVNVSDPYNGNLRTTFEVRTSASASATLVAGNASAPVTTAAPGTATWRVPSGLANGSTYYWRAQSRDENNLVGDWSGWQTVSVDTSPPAVSSVSSTQYPLREWGAVLGTSGTFAVSAGSDVADFTWWVDSGSATTVAASGTSPKTTSVTHTPVTDMVHTLNVTAKDVAGNTSPTHLHQFWVSPVPNRYSRWKFDEASGTTAADSGSGGSALTPGTLTGSASFVSGYLGNAASFTGAGGQITTSGPVLDTTKSFTVMAWVRASDLGANDFQTVVSQDGTTSSRFQVQYRKDANGGAGGWCFTMRSTDGGGPTMACANGSAWGLPVEGVWVHLAGVYDATASKIRVYVMGDPVSCGGETAETSFAGTWSATGPFVIGRAKTSGAEVDRWRGEIDDVHAFQRTLADWEICQQAAQ
ncbi:LamG-like jellyroll fold domain-containing protein [Micromonospora sp. WMMD1082]|uniref:LamG-like jellyroll fold domain-containing protein n=1 Tax=Micromonospora sp. WMMD1082 TaxID=3016104 RepID=UPI002415A432|nr:LamG-like jellyroll fold domain-containing protein [Micromonospora sp. WMMD1082]MDG4796718.1 LamG domain-containing protein [Micromonospora sp. WMMD1082]